METEILVTLDRALAQLSAIYDNVARKRALCEAVCQDCHQLLKPWPKKFSSNVEHDQVEKPDPEVVTPLPEEIEQLSLVDKALARAQKVRITTQLKTNLNSELCVGAQQNSGSHDHVSEVPDAKKTVPKSTVSQTTSEKLLPGRKVQAQPPLSKKKLPSRKDATGVISQSELDELVEKPDVTMRIVEKPVSRPTSVSSDKKQSVRYKPAHQTAPFQTYSVPSAHRSKTKTTATRPSAPRAPPIAQPTASRKMYSAASNERNLASQTSVLSSSTDVSSAQFPRSELVLDTSPVGDVGTASEQSDKKTESVSDFKQLQCADISKPLQQHAAASSSIRSVNSSPSAVSDLFTLQKDGHTVKLPVDYRKSCAMNHSLRHKLQMLSARSRQRKLRDGESTASMFVTKLNADILGQLSQSKLDQLSAINRICARCCWLTRLLESLPAISSLETSSWQCVLRSKTLLKFVLKEFIKLQEEFKQHHDVTRSMGKRTAKSSTEVFPEPHTSSQITCWLTPNLAEDYPNVSRVVTYRHRSELLQYATTLHQIQLSLLYKRVLTNIAHETLTLLEKMDPTDPYFKYTSDPESEPFATKVIEEKSRPGCSGRRVWLVLGFFLLLCLVAIGMVCWFCYKRNSSSAYGLYMNAAVASDSKQCSEIGRDILLEGGSTVDAAIATLFCIGIHCAHSSGIGGGFHMVVYDRQKGNYDREMWAFDARETAPAYANQQVFVNESLPLVGSLAIAVPGEIKGYHEAWSQFGRLPWRRLVQPTIDLCRNGYIVEWALADAIATNEALIRSTPSLRKLLVKEDGSLYAEGDKMRRPELADTLDTIATDPEEFYTGRLASDILADLHEIGANITAGDLSDYLVHKYPAVAMPLRSGDVINSLRPPSSGILLGFMLRVLEGFGLTKSDFRRVNTYQKIVETFKFAYALRTYLGDENFNNLTEVIRNITSFDFADNVRSRIDLFHTEPVPYYRPAYYLPKTESGTAHVSVIGSDGSAVSATSTINTRFGSKRVGRRTGIIFNDEMNDFLLPGEHAIPASVEGQGQSAAAARFANDVSPGKRPQSSMCPSIITNSNGDVVMVVGAAGGTYITSATAYVTAHTLWLGLAANKAVDELRLHHQLMPDEIIAERNFPKEPIEGLRSKGHVISPPSSAHAVVNAIRSFCNIYEDDDRCLLLAVSDWRKRGAPSGF